MYQTCPMPLHGTCQNLNIGQAPFLRKNDIRLAKFALVMSESGKCCASGHLYNKRACPTKKEPQQGISYLERER